MVHSPQGLRASTGRRVNRWSLAAVLAFVLVAASAAPARADGGGNSPASLSWIKVEDSHGVSIWNYEMSLDRGGITDPTKVIYSFVVDILWSTYVSVIGTAIWIIDWGLSFSWLSVVTAPVMTMGDALTQIVDRLGLTTTLLTITALVAMLWMATGKWALGVFELVMSLTIASLAVGALSNPVGLVAAKDGLLYQSRDLGLAVAAGLANGGDTNGSPDALREEVTGMLADTFVRQPAQIVNFGAVLDGGKCETAYTDVVADGPYGGEDDIREAIGDCDSDYGEVAENPNTGMATSALTLFPAALFVLLFACVLAAVVVVTALYALYQALKLIVTLLAGMLPGASRGALWMTVADLTISLVTLVFTVVFLGAYLLVVQAVFAAGAEENRVKTFFVVDLLLLAGILVFWKGRKRLKAAADRLAHTLARRPGAAATTLRPRDKLNPAELYYKGAMALGAARFAGKAGAALATGGASLATAGAAGAMAAGRAAGGTAGRMVAGLQFAASAASSMAEDAPGQRVRDRLELSASHSSARGGLGGVLALTSASLPRNDTAGPPTRPRPGGPIPGTPGPENHRRSALQVRLRPPSLAAAPQTAPDAGHPPPPRAQRESGSRPPGAPDVVPGQVVTSTASLPPSRPAPAPSARRGPTGGGAGWEGDTSRRLRIALKARHRRPIALPAAPVIRPRPPGTVETPRATDPGLG